MKPNNKRQQPSMASSTSWMVTTDVNDSQMQHRSLYFLDISDDLRVEQTEIIRSVVRTTAGTKRTPDCRILGSVVSNCQPSKKQKERSPSQFLSLCYREAKRLNNIHRQSIKALRRLSLNMTLLRHRIAGNTNLFFAVTSAAVDLMEAASVLTNLIPVVSN